MLDFTKTGRPEIDGYPEDIAYNLITIAQHHPLYGAEAAFENFDENAIEMIVDALYNIMDMADNSYNHDGWRAIYWLLDRAAMSEEHNRSYRI